MVGKFTPAYQFPHLIVIMQICLDFCLDIYYVDTWRILLHCGSVITSAEKVHINSNVSLFFTHFPYFYSNSLINYFV